MMRRSLVAFVCIAAHFAAQSAHAQQTATFKDVWDFYIERCGAAFSDPNRYLAALAIPGPDGGRVVASTPDKRIVQVLTGRAGMQEYYLVMAVGTKRMQTCLVVGVGNDGLNSSVQFDAAFRAILEREPGLMVSGGAMPHDLYFGDTEGMDYITSINDAYQYVVDGAHSDLDVITEVSFAEGEITISGYLMEFSSP